MYYEAVLDDMEDILLWGEKMGIDVRTVEAEQDSYESRYSIN